MTLKYFVDVVLICAGITAVVVTGLFIVFVVREYIKNWRND